MGKLLVCVDPGHGGDDSGATFRGVYEKDITLNIALEVERLLQYSGSIDTIMTRRRDQTLYLPARTNFANEKRADVFLSIHCNADADDDDPDDPEAEGKEVFSYPGSQGGLALGEAVKKAFGIEFPDEPFRGIKEKRLWVLRKTTSAWASLVEVAFIDNSESNRELRDPKIRNQIAFTLARAIWDFQELGI